MSFVVFSLFFLSTPSHADFNDAVLNAVNSMSQHQGSYSTSGAATQQLKRAISFENGKLAVRPDNISESYCSGATYLVFLKVIASTQQNLDSRSGQALLVTGQPDGQGVWGRWNSNGPGTASLFKELALGKNYTRWSEGKPGDFMKIFWNNEIGKDERGHSVVYLGSFRKEGTDFVKFWSSNSGMGMSIKSVPKSSIKRVIFSRLENPENIAKVQSVPHTDRYLASLTSTASSPSELYEKIGVIEGGM